MSTSSEVPAHRACASCRSQKVRCILNEANPDVCLRCAKTGRPCVFTPLQKRKQRKRTDTRVAELEKEMRAMRQALQEKDQGSRSNSPTQSQQDTESTRPQGLWYKEHQPDAPRLGQAANWENVDNTPAQAVQRSGPVVWPCKYQNKPMSEEEDVIDRGKLSMATARQLFEMYRTQLFPHYPMVAVPDDVTADSMRRSKPALFLAIIAAAAGKEDAELSKVLDGEVLQAYATRSMVQSEKSLELVQALLVSAVWYHPPSKFGQLKYYEYIHMASTMALDIGIGSRPAVRRNRLKGPVVITPHTAEDVTNPDLSMSNRCQGCGPDTGNIECRRTFVACYIITAGVSFSLRRPNLLRISSYIRESIDIIESAPDTIPTDSTLVAWARLTIIAEEIATSFCYDDPGGIASIAELRTQIMLKDFEKRLTAWHTTYENDMGTGSLLLMYFTIRLYLFEVALHIDHSPEDFRAPYQMGGLQPLPDTEGIPSQVLAETIAHSISSAHGLLDTFLAMDPEGLRALPVFSFVRVSFASFVLAKLCLSAASPWSRIGKVLDRRSLNIDSYMDRMILHVRSIIGNKPSRVPSIFLALLFKLRQWCLNPGMIEQSEDQQEQPRSGEPEGDEYDRAVMSKQQFVIDLEGPRITEQSGSESSPQTTGNADSSGSHEDVSPVPMIADGPQSTFQFGENPTPNPVQMPVGNMVPTLPMVPDGTEWMNMDGNLMQMLGDMNAFSSGGLTGLDDWAPMPGDFMNWGGAQQM